MSKKILSAFLFFSIMVFPFAEQFAQKNRRKKVIKTATQKADTWIDYKYFQYFKAKFPKEPKRNSDIFKLAETSLQFESLDEKGNSFIVDVLKFGDDFWTAVGDKEDIFSVMDNQLIYAFDAVVKSKKKLAIKGRTGEETVFEVEYEPKNLLLTVIQRVFIKEKYVYRQKVIIPQPSKKANSLYIKSYSATTKKFFDSLQILGEYIDDEDYPPPSRYLPPGTIEKGIYDNQKLKFSFPTPEWTYISDTNLVSVAESFQKTIPIKTTVESDGALYLLALVDYPKSKNIVGVKTYNGDFRSDETLKAVSEKAKAKDLKHPFLKAEIIKDIEEISIDGHKSYMFKILQSSDKEKYWHTQFIIRIDEYNYLEFNWVFENEDGQNIIEKSMSGFKFTK